jgi:hypothetical protein
MLTVGDDVALAEFNASHSCWACRGHIATRHSPELMAREQLACRVRPVREWGSWLIVPPADPAGRALPGGSPRRGNHRVRPHETPQGSLAFRANTHSHQYVTSGAHLFGSGEAGRFAVARSLSGGSACERGRSRARLQRPTPRTTRPPRSPHPRPRGPVPPGSHAQIDYGKPRSWIDPATGTRHTI